jgi:hypothetical protein
MIGAFLEKIYGKVLVNRNLNIPSELSAYESRPPYNDLRLIYGKLQTLRGYDDFVKVKKLSPVDYYVPDPGFIVEVDESQHFTEQRKVTLESYPEHLRLGFDKDRWITLCASYRRKDNDPPYRDEQRAWYDTLRDFAPLQLGIFPTARIFPGDAVWCDLQTDVDQDVQAFLRSYYLRRE